MGKTGTREFQCFAKYHLTVFHSGERKMPSMLGDLLMRFKTPGQEVFVGFGRTRNRHVIDGVERDS